MREIGRFKFPPYDLLKQMNIWTEGIAVIAPLALHKTVKTWCPADVFSPRQYKTPDVLPARYHWALVYDRSTYRLYHRSEGVRQGHLRKMRG